MQDHLALLSVDLQRYRSTWAGDGCPKELGVAEQRDLIARFEEFAEREPLCFSRECLEGHMTGSAVIVTEDLRSTLLTHHRKLNLWLQLGGHADGNPVLSQTALREGEEESGLPHLDFFPYGEVFGIRNDQPLLFDLDIHWIPERKSEPGHYHYDARYLLYTRRPDALAMTEESHDLKWFALDEARTVTTEISMHRMFAKIKYLAELPPPPKD